MLPEGQTGLCEAGTARRTRQELDTKRLFQPEDAATDDGLGDAKPPRRQRQSAGISHCNESSQVLELHLYIPRRYKRPFEQSSRAICWDDGAFVSITPDAPNPSS